MPGRLCSRCGHDAVHQKKSAAVVGMYAKQAEHQTATGTHHVAELDKLVD